MSYNQPVLSCCVGSCLTNEQDHIFDWKCLLYKIKTETEIFAISCWHCINSMHVSFFALLNELLWNWMNIYGIYLKKQSISAITTRLGDVISLKSLNRVLLMIDFDSWLEIRYVDRIVKARVRLYELEFLQLMSWLSTNILSSYDNQSVNIIQNRHTFDLNDIKFFIQNT